MTQLLFVRHAETEMAGTFCGSSDPPLNDRGRLQTEKLAAELALSSVSIIYTSDLLRARQTAQTLSDSLSVPLNVQPDLREIGFGAWESLTWTEVQKRNPEYARRWIDEFPNFTPPCGEPYADFHARVVKVVARLRTTHAHKQAIVVTHAGVMRIVMEQLCGVDTNESWTRTKPYCATFLYPALAASDEVSVQVPPPCTYTKDETCAPVEEQGKHP